MEKTCPRCGISSARREFTGSFCVSCANVGIECPRKIEILKCRNCGNILRQDGSTAHRAHSSVPTPGARELEQLVLKSCKGKYENARFDAEMGEAVFLVRVGNAFSEVRRRIEVTVKERTCERCAKAAGGYFEAIIQLRGNREKAEKICEKLVRAIEKDSFVAKIEELKEGIDIYIGGKKAAEDALSKYELAFARSEKLGGVKDGKRVYRSTFCVRLRA